MPQHNSPGAWPHAKRSAALRLSCATFLLLGCASDNAPSPSTPGDVEVDGGSRDAASPESPLDAASSSESGAIDARVGVDDAATRQPAESGAATSAVRIVRGATQQRYWDLIIRGVALSEHEGKRVTVLIGMAEHPDERLGLATTEIVSGTFELSFPQVWEASLYKLKQAFIDVDRNGRCDAGNDLVFFDARASIIDALEIHATPVPTPAAFLRAFDPAEDCAALNAPFPMQ